MAIESKNPALHAALLAGFALVAALLLSSGNMATKGPIAERKHEDLVRSLAMVIPDEYHDNDLVKDLTMAADAKGEWRMIHRARKNGKVTAIAFERIEHGYGEIHLVMGINARGHILGVRVLEHTETPGLGDKIEVKKDPWILGFDGLWLGNPTASKWRVKKDGGVFDQFSGATITPRAVVRSVREGLEFFRLNKKDILAGRNMIDPRANAAKEQGS